MLAPGAITPAEAFDLTIGGLIELTGPLSEIGPPIEKAALLAVKVANQAAADAGVPMTIDFAAADAQGDPQAAVSAARALIDRNASCILGPATTPEAIAVLNGVTMQRRMTLWPQASSTRLRTVEHDGTIFRTIAADDLQSRALVAAIERHAGKGKRASVVFRNEPYGDALSKAFTSDWEAVGGSVVATVSFDPQQMSFDSEAGQAVAADPDVYVVIDYPDTYARLGAALVRTGAFDPSTLFVADALSFGTVPRSIPAEAIEGAFGVVGGAPQGTGAYALFDRLWTEEGGVEDASYTPNAFDAAMICFLAAIRAGSAEPEAIRDNVRDVTREGAPQFTIETIADAVRTAAAGKPIDYVGVSGQFRFAPNGDTTTGLYDVFQYREGRQVTIDQIDVR